MKRYALRLFTLWLLLVALCGGVIAIRRANAEPNELQDIGFDRCEGFPCYRGIKPSVTTWKDAKKALSSLVQFEDRYGFTIFADYWGNSCDFPHITDSEPLWSILCELHFSKHRLSVVGSVIEQYGLPYSVSFERDEIMTLDFPGMSATVNMKGQNRLSPNSTIMYIEIHDPSWVSMKDLANCSHQPARHFEDRVCWRGFTTLNRYVPIRP